MPLGFAGDVNEATTRDTGAQAHPQYDCGRQEYRDDRYQPSIQIVSVDTTGSIAIACL